MNKPCETTSEIINGARSVLDSRKFNQRDCMSMLKCSLCAILCNMRTVGEIRSLTLVAVKSPAFCVLLSYVRMGNLKREDAMRR